MEKRKIRIYFDGNLFVLFQLFRLQEDWILQEAGSCLENVLTLTVYLCDIDEYGRFNEVYKRYFEKDLPARTCIQAGNFGERMTMVVFSLKNGAPIPYHSHPHEQMGMVMQGKVKLIIDGKEQVVQSGSAWHIPSNVVHSGECLEDDTVVLEVFSPPREDLVKK